MLYSPNVYFVQPLWLNFRGCVFFFVDRVLIIIIFSSFGLGNAGSALGCAVIDTESLLSSSHCYQSRHPSPPFERTNGTALSFNVAFCTRLASRLMSLSSILMCFCLHN